MFIFYLLINSMIYQKGVALGVQDTMVEVAQDIMAVALDLEEDMVNEELAFT